MRPTRGAGGISLKDSAFLIVVIGVNNPLVNESENVDSIRN